MLMPPVSKVMPLPTKATGGVPASPGQRSMARAGGGGGGTAYREQAVQPRFHQLGAGEHLHVHACLGQAAQPCREAGGREDIGGFGDEITREGAAGEHGELPGPGAGQIRVAGGRIQAGKFWGVFKRFRAQRAVMPGALHGAGQAMHGVALGPATQVDRGVFAGQQPRRGQGARRFQRQRIGVVAHPDEHDAPRAT